MHILCGLCSRLRGPAKVGHQGFCEATILRKVVLYHTLYDAMFQKLLPTSNVPVPVVKQCLWSNHEANFLKASAVYIAVTCSFALAYDKSEMSETSKIPKPICELSGLRSPQFLHDQSHHDHTQQARSGINYPARPQPTRPLMGAAAADLNLAAAASAAAAAAAASVSSNSSAAKDSMPAPGPPPRSQSNSRKVSVSRGLAFIYIEYQILILILARSCF